MNFRVIRPVTEPAKEVGQTFAWTFDCGRIESEQYGNAYILGHISSQLPFIDHDAILDATEYNTTQELRQYFLDVLLSFGFNVDMVDESSNKMNLIFTQEAIDIFAVMYVGTDPKKYILIVIIIALVYYMETLTEEKQGNEDDLSVVISDLIDFVKGTSDKAVPNSGIQMSLTYTIIASLCHILRTEAKNLDPSGWQYLESEMIEFIQSIDSECRLMEVNEDTYLATRNLTIGVKTTIEVSYIAFGIKIPHAVRIHPLYNLLMTLTSMEIAFLNDIIGLRRELEKGEKWNIVLIHAQKHGLQTAFELTLHQIYEYRHKITQAKQDIINIFPIEKCIVEIFDQILKFEYISSYFFFMEFAKIRYGDKMKMSLSVIEYVKEINNTPSGITCPEDVNGGQGYENQINENNEILQHLQLDNKNKDINEVEISDKTMKTRVEILKIIEIPKFDAHPASKNELNLNHVAIIPDGNRRWAKSNGLQGHEGHGHGTSTLIRLIDKFFLLNIHTVTAWGMSTENFERSNLEKEALFSYMCSHLVPLLQLAHTHEARIFHIGSNKRLSRRLKRDIENTVSETSHYTRHIINLAIDYGGLQEMIDAINKIEKLPITKEDFGKLMYTGNQPYPEPDIIIRTGAVDSKTVRTSGFMPWQSTYSEFLFLDKYFPDLTGEDIDEVMEYFKKANRRFGK